MTTSDQILIFLKKENKSIEWLADKTKISVKDIKYQLKNNYFTINDLIKLENLGILKN